MYYPPPIPPLPPRSFYESDKAYEAARKSHDKMLRERSEMMKDDEAMMILLGIFLVGSVILALGFVSVLSFGWRGPFYGVAVCGLLWVAYKQIRVRL